MKIVHSRGFDRDVFFLVRELVESDLLTMRGRPRHEIFASYAVEFGQNYRITMIVMRSSMDDQVFG